MSTFETPPPADGASGGQQADDEIPIDGEMIRLGQFLKLANIVEDGATARLLLAEEIVLVNGELEVRRGRQLHPGDLVRLELEEPPVTLRVARAQASDS